MRFVAAALFLLLPAAACMGSGESPEGPSARRVRGPNILIIVTDDQRYPGTLGVMPSTKRLFGRGGKTFTNAFATTPMCCPSRASIFTGRYVHNHGVKYQSVPGRLDQESTLQRYLQEAGYETAIAGKYLNGWDLSTDPPYFDQWAISLNGYRGMTFNTNGTMRKVEGYSPHYVGQRALEWLRSFDRSRPWFLYVSTPSAHPPFDVEERYETARVSRWGEPRGRRGGPARQADPGTPKEIRPGDER